MKFSELDDKMRVFETAHDQTVLPDMYIVARIDGRSFTRLTKEIEKFEAPFDTRFRDLMVETTKHLMTCGFKVLYGYTQSDEISLLFDLNDNGFGRKHRKINSVLAGEASAKFSLSLGRIAAFDCRVCELPNAKLVIDYFRWRNEDAHRNALNAHCYWLLRGQGQNETAATEQIKGVSTAFKNELLFQNGINFNEIPNWQKRGTGLYFADVDKEGFNPKTQEKTVVKRREIKVDYELPMRDEYDDFISQFIATDLQI
jgi:tRNA(His) guanylyltransferase